MEITAEKSQEQGAIYRMKMWHFHPCAAQSLIWHMTHLPPPFPACGAPSPQGSRRCHPVNATPCLMAYERIKTAPKEGSAQTAMVAGRGTSYSGRGGHQPAGKLNMGECEKPGAARTQGSRSRRQGSGRWKHGGMAGDRDLTRPASVARDVTIWESVAGRLSRPPLQWRH